MVGFEDEVAIFDVSCAVCVFAVYECGADDVCGHVGCAFAERVELWKKWFVPIDFLGVLLGVPFVAPPIFVEVDGKGLVFVELRDDFFSGRVAFSCIKSSCVAFEESSDHAALRALGWGWHVEEFVKALVLGGDCEGLCASFAGFGCWHLCFCSLQVLILQYNQDQYNF